MVPTPYLHSAESVALDAVSIRVPVGNRWHTQKVAKQSLIKEPLKMVWTGLRDPKGIMRAQDPATLKSHHNPRLEGETEKGVIKAGLNQK